MRNIREARPDIPDVYGIQRLINIGVREGKILPRKEYEIWKSIETFFVCEEDGIIGCAALDVYSSKLAEIRSVVVLPMYRRQGIGTALVQKCLEKAKEKQVFEVLAITDQLSLFKKMGFHKQLQGQYPLFLRMRHD